MTRSLSYSIVKKKKKNMKWKTKKRKIWWFWCFFHGWTILRLMGQESWTCRSSNTCGERSKRGRWDHFTNLNFCSCSTNLFHLTVNILMCFQLIFKRYDKDKTCSISSFEMRNAVNEAGEQHRRNTFWDLNTHRMLFLTAMYFYFLDS